MSLSDFELLLNNIGSKIQVMNTDMKKEIPISKKLAITLKMFGY
jgi:hypothetical protein